MIEFRRTDFPPLSNVRRLQGLATADAAIALARLQAEHGRAGFRLLPLKDYLQQLFAAANVSVKDVLAQFGLTELSHPNTENIRPLALLSQEIGLTLSETLLQLRFGFAASTGNALLATTMRERGSGSLSGKLVEQAKQVLEDVETSYTTQQGREIRHLTEEVRAIFALVETAP